MDPKNEISDNTNRSLEFFKNKSFETYKEWIDINLKLNKQSAMSQLLHLLNFLKNHSGKLGNNSYFYVEKLFYVALELRLVQLSRSILNKLEGEFGREPKIIRMSAELAEIDIKPDLKNFEMAITTYKKLIEHSQDDKVTLKKYLGFLKSIFEFDASGMKRYTELWNEYLKVYMDDFDAWYELSDVYIKTNNFKQAVYCLEEVLLHIPNNHQTYTRIGDLLSSSNNSEAALSALKYYSQSILIKPTPRAFWGIIYAINILIKAKAIDQKTKNLFKISSINLKNFYAGSPFSVTLDTYLTPISNKLN